LQSHYEKHQKAQSMRNSLAEQIRIHHCTKEKDEKPKMENPFARSESLMAMYQREKAKQLYHEQLAIVKQREDYAKKVAEIEIKHSLSRLEHSKRE
jgi:F420-dependent methylenetetrahydromethanopterin dehydrogenase